MKYKNIPILFLSIALLVSCSSVKVNYDKNADFSKYKTFAYVKDGILRSKLPRKFKRIIVYGIDDFL